MNDQHIQQQLMDLSIAPPPAAWAQVALCLEQEAVWQQASAWEVAAPPAAWETIAAEMSGVAIDTATWQPLQVLHVQAPETSWEQIDLVLLQDAAAAPLRNSEVQPPTRTWEAVAPKLPAPPAPVFSLKRVVQVAAAAVVTGILFFSGYRYLNLTVYSNETVVTAPAPQVPAPAKETGPQNVIAVPADVLTAPEAPNASPVSVAAAAAKKAGTAIKKAALHQTAAITASNTAFEETRYMLILDASGELVRVSPKLGQLPCAPNESGTADAVAALDSPACKEWLKTLQERMALSASIDGFGGGLDFNEVLKVTK